MQPKSDQNDLESSDFSNLHTSIPIVYLSEKSLQRLHMKLQCSNLDDSFGSTEIKNKISSSASSIKKKKREPKLQFYRAGQTQLSRKSNESQTSVEDCVSKDTLSPKAAGSSKRPQQNINSNIGDFENVMPKCVKQSVEANASFGSSKPKYKEKEKMHSHKPSRITQNSTTGSMISRKVSCSKEKENKSKESSVKNKLTNIETKNQITKRDLINTNGNNYTDNNAVESAITKNITSSTRELDVASRASPVKRELFDYETGKMLSVGPNIDSYTDTVANSVSKKSKLKQHPSRPKEVLHHSPGSSQSLDQLSDQSVLNLERQATDLESKLENMLDKLDCTEQTVTTKRFFEERDRLKLIYKCIVLKDIEYTSKNSIDNLLWKNIFYQLVEKLRGQLEFCFDRDKENIKLVLINIFDQGNIFYKDFLNDLQTAYKFSLDQLPFDYNSKEIKRKSHLKKIKLAIMVCQKIFLCLGDLARYRESTNESTEFGVARRWYLSAKKVEPRNGRPYNQLALLAVLTKRRLDAVYYYIRSLGAGNPVLTARESLLALFNEIRRKREYLKQREKNQPKSPDNSAPNNGQLTANKLQPNPQEVWILPHLYSGAQQDFDELSLTRTADSEVMDWESDLNKTKQPKPPDVVNTSTLKEFILVFLNLHGILFTRIAFDMFEEQMAHALSLFSSILNSTKGMPEQTAVYLFTVNFFTVYDQHEKSKGDFYNDMFFTHAVEFAFSMITCLCSKVASILKTMKIANKRNGVDSESTMWISMFKVCCDWLYTNKLIWTGHNDFTRFHNIYDVTYNLAEVLNLLHSSYYISSDVHKFKKVKREDHSLEELIKIDLPEDEEFKGFCPLNHFEEGPHFLHRFDSYNSEMFNDACNFVRFHVIYEFLLYLCGIESPLIAYKGGQYITLVPKVIEIEQTFSTMNNEQVVPGVGAGNKNLQFSQPNTVFVENVQSRNVDDSQYESDLGDLKLYHNALQQTKKYQDKRQQLIQVSLNASQTNITTSVVKVCPQFLVPDTNCFIDHLNLIHKILERSDYYVVCVPLIVFIELKGLSTHCKSSTNHAISVKDNAKIALEFLSDVFVNGINDYRIKALTNQGTKLETFSFLSQEVESKGNNDDFILQCCLRHEAKQSKITTNSNVLTTVLLTDDRNLRVKALTKNTPTKSLSDFCKWTMM